MYEAIVIGASAGGLHALATVLPTLPAAFGARIAVAQHRDPKADGYLIEHLAGLCAIGVKEADDKEDFRPGIAYFAPANYHLLVESDCSLSLSADDKVHFSRPSVDVLFASAADAFGAKLVGVVLTGANEDGAAGLFRIKARGGLAIVQTPANAEARRMPEAAIAAVDVDHVAPIEEIARMLNDLFRGGEHGARGDA